MKRHTCSINNAVPRQHLARLGLLLGLFMLFSQTTAFGQNTGFTYQGRLTDGGTAANGNYDLQFQLFDSLSGGTQIGSTQTLNVVAVSAGTGAGGKHRWRGE